MEPEKLCGMSVRDADKGLIKAFAGRKASPLSAIFPTKKAIVASARLRHEEIERSTRVAG